MMDPQAPYLIFHCCLWILVIRVSAKIAGSCSNSLSKLQLLGQQNNGSDLELWHQHLKKKKKKDFQVDVNSAWIC